MLWKCCTQYASKFGKLSSGHRTGKGHFSFQSQRKAVPKNVQIIAQFSSVAQLCPTLYDPMNHSTPGLPVHQHISLISYASKVRLKIFQARLHHYMKWELPDVQAGFRKGRETRDQIASICWIIERARNSKENIYFCFIAYVNAFDCVDHYKLWKILKEIRIPDCLTCLLRNLYAGQEATVRTGHGTADWFQIWKGVNQGCMLSPCLFNLHAEYIMGNAGLDEAQAGIKTEGRNISNPR